MKHFLISTFLCSVTLLMAEGGPQAKAWPEQVETTTFTASIDQSRQSMLIYTAKDPKKRPLLVALHTWSNDYTQAGGEAVYARWCIENDWHFIHPDFRGPNNKPDACGSEKVVQDIRDAVAYMVKNHRVDTDRVYLVGVSGGGHAALLMAGRAPEIWAGVSAWAPISDIHAWWKQKDQGRFPKYARNIEKVVGGRPDQDEKALQECVKRSPITYLEHASGVNLDINAGIADGHGGGSVPFTHSLLAFNEVVAEKDRIKTGLVEAFYEKQALPTGLGQADADPLYAGKPVVFRKTSGNARVTIFQGGHEIIHNAALNWLAQQRKGQAAIWEVSPVRIITTDKDEGNSGK